MSAQRKLINASDQFYNHLSNNEFVELGNRQWRSLRDIEAYYDKMPMTEFNNGAFSSNVWVVTNPNARIKNINWNKVLLKDNSNYPLVILLKISIYHRIEQQKYSATSFSGVVPFAQRFTPYLQRENILIAKENTPFLPASIITKETLHSWFVDLIRCSPFKDVSHIEYWSRLIANSAHAIPKAVNVLKVNFEVPWKDFKRCKGLEPPQVYLNQLLGSNATRTEILSYKPYSSITISNLLDKSIPIFTDHASALIDIFTAFKTHYPNYKTKTEVFLDESFTPDNYFRVMKKITKKHKAALDCFPHLKVTVDKQFMIDKKGNHNLGLFWINDLHKQCIAASVWVILLTSAIRNVDLRKSLMRDCDRYSKGKSKRSSHSNPPFNSESDCIFKWH
jgi:hypothetical protein